MQFKTVWAVYYSGSGSTRRLLRGMAEAAGEALMLPVRELDYSRLLEETLALAGAIAQNSPFAVSRAKRSVNGGREMLPEEALEWERDLFGECGDSRDRREGMTAFIEKRPRVFTGE